MEFDLVISNGTAVRPDGTSVCDIGVKDGCIAYLGRGGSLADAEATETLDATGMHVLPGGIDTHMHWGNYGNYDDDVAVESAAAALGGTTSVVLYHRFAQRGAALGSQRFTELPFDETLERTRNRAAVNWLFVPIVYDAKSRAAALELMETEGLSAVKTYMAYRDICGAEEGDDWNKLDDGGLLTLMQELAASVPNAMVCVHAENAAIINEFMRRFAGDADWADANPTIAEHEAVMRAGVLADYAGVRLYAVHLSGDHAVDAVRRLRALGIDVVAETCVHYLLADELSDAAMYKYSPPIRDHENSEKLWQALAAGDVQTIGSDSVCVPQDLKADSVWESARGVPSGSILRPAVLTKGVAEGRISLEDAVRVTSENPAKAFNLYPKKGVIAEASDADLVVVDLETARSVDEVLSPNGIENYAYGQAKLRGWPVWTVIGGSVVAAGGRLTGSRYGELVKAVPGAEAVVASAEAAAHPGRSQ